MVIFTNPAFTRNRLAVRSTATRISVTSRNIPTPANIVSVDMDVADNMNNVVICYSFMPRKLMKAMPISAVMMKVMPIPRRGFGTLE